MRRACPAAKILLGSGVTAENVRAYAQADGFIVGTSLKRAGWLSNPVDVKRVMGMVKAMRAVRH